MSSPSNNARIIAAGTYVTRREARHKILIKNNARSTCRIDNCRSEISILQGAIFTIARLIRVMKARRERSFA